MPGSSFIYFRLFKSKGEGICGTLWTLYIFSYTNAKWLYGGGGGAPNFGAVNAFART